MFGTNVYSTALIGPGKEPRMTFALVLALVLVLSTIYLVHQWYTEELRDPTL